MEDDQSPTGWGHMGRLAGLASGPDGALYLSDDEGGVIYRVHHAEDQASDRPDPTFTNADSETLNIGLVAAD